MKCSKLEYKLIKIKIYAFFQIEFLLIFNSTINIVLIEEASREFLSKKLKMVSNYFVF